MDGGRREGGREERRRNIITKQFCQKNQTNVFA
jgi:hypothetical protein